MYNVYAYTIPYIYSSVYSMYNPHQIYSITSIAKMIFCCVSAKEEIINLKPQRRTCVSNCKNRNIANVK